MEHLSDHELLVMFRNEDQKHYAFNLIVAKYQHRIYYFVRRILISHEDTNDVVQNIFIKVWNNLENFREDSKFFTWLYRIASNESISFLKNRNLRTFFSLSSPEASMLNTIKEETYIDGKEIQQRLLQAILKLPKKQQLIFNMRYFDELSYEQISEILGTSVGALKASYHIAVKKIEHFVTAN